MTSRLIRKSLILANLNASFKDVLDAARLPFWQTVRREDSKGLKKFEVPAPSTTLQSAISINIRREETRYKDSVVSSQSKRKSENREQLEGQSETRNQLPPETALATVSYPAGRLRYFKQSWEDITSDKLILSWIEGYRIPFESNPFQYSILNETAESNAKQLEIKNLISKLLKKGAITLCRAKED